MAQTEYQTIEIQTADEFFNYIKKYQKSAMWKFRGQSNTDWPLLPKAGRNTYADRDDKVFFRNWKRRAIQFIPNRSFTQIELLAIAQHNGLPTRLLDWTHNPLVAAFFASIENFDVDGSVYAMWCNKLVYDDFEPFTNSNQIVLYQPTLHVPRLVSQLGYFTVHCTPSLEISANNPISSRIEKILIKKEAKRDLSFILNQYGINFMTIYPDIEGLSKHLTWYWENLDYWTGEDVEGGQPALTPLG